MKTSDTILIMFNSKKERKYHDSWQGESQGYEMWECSNFIYTHSMPQDIPSAIETYDPQLPWADIHFEERVSGEPLNPPPSHTMWHRGTEQYLSHKDPTVFSHTYPERFWGSKTGALGVRYSFGDLNTLHSLMQKDPSSRQLYLPIWYPEDLTAALEGERVPCTLGYYFWIDKDQLNLNYIIRSCDVIRHLNNDLYLTWRLAHYLKGDYTLGKFTFMCFNLHCFVNDSYTLEQRIKHANS